MSVVREKLFKVSIPPGSEESAPGPRYSSSEGLNRASHQCARGAPGAPKSAPGTWSRGATDPRQGTGGYVWHPVGVRAVRCAHSAPLGLADGTGRCHVPPAGVRAVRCAHSAPLGLADGTGRCHVPPAGVRAVRCAHSAPLGLADGTGRCHVPPAGVRAVRCAHSAPLGLGTLPWEHPGRTFHTPGRTPGAP